MNKKHITSIIISILLICCGFIQAKSQGRSFSVELGKLFEISPKLSVNDIVAHDSSGIFVVRKSKEGINQESNYTLEHYNSEYSLKNSLDLDHMDERHETILSKIIHWNNKLYVFYSTVDQRSKLISLCAKELNKQTLKPRTGNKLIRQFSTAGKNKNLYSKSYYRFSADSSKLLICCGLPYADYDSESFSFIVLDITLNVAWQRTIDIPYSDDLFDVKSFRVDNQGNAYLLGAVYNQKRKETRNGLLNYSFEIFACRDNGSTVHHYPINLKDKFLTDMQIEILDNQNIACAGFFSLGSATSIIGAYFIEFSSSENQVKAKSFKDFEFSLITQNVRSKELKKSIKKKEQGIPPELYQYELDKMQFDKDRNIILIGEQLYVKEERTYMSNGLSINSTHYNNDDIIVVKISTKGDVLWAQKIPKSQHSINSVGFYSSYCSAIIGGDTFIIFNDNPENFKENNVGRPADYLSAESVSIIIRIDQNGKMSKQPIFDSADQDLKIRPKICEQISENEIILFGQKGKKQRFARLRFY